MITQVQENEPGNLLYRLCKEKDSRNYTVIETYRDQESVDAHGEAIVISDGPRIDRTADSSRSSTAYSQSTAFCSKFTDRKRKKDAATKGLV